MKAKVGRVIPIAPGVPPLGEVESLYEVRRKIYPRAVSGWFARWRWSLVILTQVIFYGLPWLEWNARQPVVYDQAASKFNIIWQELRPQDFIYLAVILVVR
jgi:hypothetical protein